jgi:hypothetical protein
MKVLILGKIHYFASAESITTKVVKSKLKIIILIFFQGTFSIPNTCRKIGTVKLAYNELG